MMYLPVTLLIIILVILFMLSAFLSASETALIAINKIRLRHLVKSGRKRAEMVHNLITKLDRLLTAILIGNNFVNISISAIFTVIIVNIFGPRWGIIISTFCVSILILVFCEITPKIFAAQYAQKVSFLVAPFIKPYVAIAEPIIKIFTSLSRFIIKLFGGKPGKRSPLITEDELRLMIEIGKEEGVVTDEERKMLQRIFIFGDTKVADVMVLRKDMIYVDINASLQTLLDAFVEKGFSRVPVCRDNIDNIVGIVYGDHILDLIKDKEAYSLKDLVDEAYFIGPSKKVIELLRYFQRNKLQVAIVVDENKKVLGLVTLEDLLEEIVGEIEEEVIDKD